MIVVDNHTLQVYSAQLHVVIVIVYKLGMQLVA